MCGGQLYVIPCSRVGHINRQHVTNRFEIMKVVEYNNLKLVHTWLDEYKVKDTSLVWEDESENREGLALKKPSTAFQIPNFVLFLKFGSRR